MKNHSSEIIHVTHFLPSAIANLVKSGTFALTVPALLPIGTACGPFNKKTYSVNDNTPPRLTSVAHLGGFLFFMGLMKKRVYNKKPLSFAEQLQQRWSSISI